MKKSAVLFDLVVIAAVFWAVLSLRFLEVSNLGPISMGVSFVVIWGLLKFRGQTFRDLGLFKPDSWKKAAQQAGFVAFIIFAATVIGLWGFSSIFGETAPGAAITQQPQTLAYFLFDIFILTWIFTAIGEEVFFRGFLLNRFQALFGGLAYTQILAVLAQAIWFGSGHMSQGLTGMLTTGLIGAVLGFYFIRQKEPRTLVPLILAHAFVDTFVLSANFFQN